MKGILKKRINHLKNILIINKISKIGKKKKQCNQSKAKQSNAIG